MKLLGIQAIDGGIAIALPSGRQVLVALPEDRERAAVLLGRRVLDLLEDPAEPHAERTPQHDADTEAEDDDPFAAIDAGLQAGSMILHVLQSVSRGRGR